VDISYESPAGPRPGGRPLDVGVAARPDPWRIKEDLWGTDVDVLMRFQNVNTEYEWQKIEDGFLAGMQVRVSAPGGAFTAAPAMKSMRGLCGLDSVARALAQQWFNTWHGESPLSDPLCCSSGTGLLKEQRCGR
jgi:hypothetical protein